MRYHTNNPAQRATDIADREAKIVWQETHDFSLYLKCWLEVYKETILEIGI